MLTGTEQRLLALIALLAMVALLSAPAAHDHVPGSVCHVCSVAQTVLLTAAALLSGAKLRLIGVHFASEPRRPISCVVSLRIPRAPPA